MSSPSRRLRRKQLRRLGRCPDCNADVRVIKDGPDGALTMGLLSVAHDDTCPTWRQAGAQPFREIRVYGGSAS